jgi:hypothetical protein
VLSSSLLSLTLTEASMGSEDFSKCSSTRHSLARCHQAWGPHAGFVSSVESFHIVRILGIEKDQRRLGDGNIGWKEHGKDICF